MLAAPKRLGSSTRPRVQFPASRGKTLFTIRGIRLREYAPQTYPETVASQSLFGNDL